MKEQILIIEDDEAIVKVLRRALAYEGYQVNYALDGEAGLNIARDRRPDLVILDLMLPGMDGVEVCQRLRAGGNVLILMLTARDTLHDRVQGLDAAPTITWSSRSSWKSCWRERALCCAAPSPTGADPIFRRPDPGYLHPPGHPQRPGHLPDCQGIRPARAVLRHPRQC